MKLCVREIQRKAHFILTFFLVDIGDVCDHQKVHQNSKDRLALRLREKDFFFNVQLAA